MKSFDLIPCIVWIILAAFVAFQSIRLNLGRLVDPGPGFLPFCCSVILCLFALFLLFSQLFEKRRPYQIKAVKPEGFQLVNYGQSSIFNGWPFYLCLYHMGKDRIFDWYSSFLVFPPKDHRHSVFQKKFDRIYRWNYRLLSDFSNMASMYVAEGFIEKS